MIFKDVSRDDPGFVDIDMVSNEGIMIGDPDGNFRPDDYVTRREMAHLVARRAFRHSILTHIVPRIKKAVMRLQRANGESGSGAFITPDGYIITNRHVVGQDRSLAYIDEGVLTGLHVQVVAVSDKHDLALCKFDGPAPAYLGFSAQDVFDGQHVAVIGQPKGYIDSITQGVVSHSLRPANPLSEPDCFQTDAPINPGNSGGPVINAYGEIVGIAVSKFVSIDTEGIGFAIHGRYARDFARECGVRV